MGHLDHFSLHVVFEHLRLGSFKHLTMMLPGPLFIIVLLPFEASLVTFLKSNCKKQVALIECLINEIDSNQ